MNSSDFVYQPPAYHYDDHSFPTQHFTRQHHNNIDNIKPEKNPFKRFLIYLFPCIFLSKRKKEYRVYLHSSVA